MLPSIEESARAQIAQRDKELADLGQRLKRQTAEIDRLKETLWDRLESELRESRVRQTGSRPTENRTGAGLRRGPIGIAGARARKLDSLAHGLCLAEQQARRH